MMIHARCTFCRKTGNVPSRFLGRCVRCKRCNTSFKVCLTTPSHAHKEPALVSGPAESWENAWENDMPPVLVDLPRNLT